MTILAAPSQHSDKKRANKLYSFEEYLNKEEKAMYKSEFYNGKIIRMPGGKLKHNIIANNIATSLRFAIKKQKLNYLVTNSDQKIFIPNQEIAVYPDALVISEKPNFWNGRKDLITNPLLIVEVLSNSTRGYDRGEKFVHYRTLPSFKEYILIEQDKQQVEVWYKPEENTWKIKTFTDISSLLLFNSIPVEIQMSEIYEGTEDI